MQLIQLIRSLLRDRLNTLVIIISLAVGIACINLIFLFLNRELSTDGFHKYKDQIYALKCDDPWIPGEKMYHCKSGSAEYMKANIAQVEDFCRYNNSNPLKIIVNNEEYFDHPQIIGASENFFRFFSYKLLTNNPVTVLESANSLVISADLADKYFGKDDPVGKIITLVNRNKTDQMTVTGIFEKPGDNTQINFDMVRRIGDIDSRCYIKLVKDADPKELEKLFSEKKETIPVINTGTSGPTYYLEPLQKAYFDTSRGLVIENNRDRRDLWIALIIGLMIIGIAIFNYLGVLTNKLLGKVKEYYLRRINGSTIRDLIARFMLENSIIVAISFLIGMFLMLDSLPFFNTLIKSNITNSFIWQPRQIAILTGVLAFVLLITLLFGTYLIRSNLNINLLKTDQDQTVRIIQIPLFNIFQLASSIALIICSLIIIRQMNFITQKPIGLNKDVLEVRIPPQYKDKAGAFKDELLKTISVNNVSVVGASPLLEHFMVLLKYQQDGVEKEYSPSGFSGDENYLDVLGIELIDGTGFSETLSANTKKCLINQSFAGLFPDQDLIGKGIPGMEDMIVTGIVEDFHFSDLKSRVEPALISFDNKGWHLLVKPSENQVQSARSAITDIWQKLIPDYPLDIESVGDRFEWYHRGNVNFKRLIVSCSLISLFLSMIGMFAVSYQKTRTRTKEIGIRKINGANIIEILAMINKDFIRWTVIAFIIAVPIAWYAMHIWLENYSYRTDVKWWIFALSGVIVLAISLLTISWQTLRAAMRNPVEALRYE
jgi:putative ABC transport system permease protein